MLTGIEERRKFEKFLRHLQEIVTIAKHGNKVKAAYVRMAVRTVEKVLELQGGKEE